MDFKYTVDENADEPIMVIGMHIGYDEDEEEGKKQGVDGNQFARELLFLDTLGKKRIQIHINSIGGIVLEGMAIYSAILKTKTKVDTYNGGMAASISAVIFMAGAKRVMADYAIFMIHNPYGPDSEASTILNLMRDSIAKMISSRSGIEEAKVLGWMDEETYMNAERCIAEGIATEVEGSETNNKPRLSNVNDAKAIWRDASKIFNKIKPNKMSELKEIANKLNLNPEASFSAINTEIDKLKNKADESDKKASDATDKAKEMEDKFKKSEADYKEAKDALDAFKKEKEESDKKAADDAAADNKAKAEAMVDTAVRAGKIKNDAAEIAKWNARAIVNHADTKEIIDSLNGVVKGANIVKDSAKVINKEDGVIALDPENTAGYVATMNAKNYIKAASRIK